MGKRTLSLFLVVLLLGLGTSAWAAEKLTYSIGWVIYGRDLGWLVARDKGYYKAEGLDVKIVRGFGGADTAKKLGAGSYEIAGVVAASVIFGRAAGVPLKIIGMQHDRVPFVIRTVEGRGINHPKDIEGRKFGTPAGDATWANMPAFAQINGIDLKKVNVINTSPASRGPALIAGAFDAATGFVTEYPFHQGSATGRLWIGRLRVWPGDDGENDHVPGRCREEVHAGFGQGIQRSH
jgi:NitT/TauT family transport system substrate-binding protein